MFTLECEMPETDTFVEVTVDEAAVMDSAEKVWGDMASSCAKLALAFPECAENGVVSLECLEKKTRMEFNEFINIINDMSAMYGVSLCDGIVLKRNGSRKVVCANEHPDKARIQEMLDSDVSLRIRFSRLCAYSNWLRVAKLREELRTGDNEKKDKKMQEWHSTGGFGRVPVFTITVYRGRGESGFYFKKVDDLVA